MEIFLIVVSIILVVSFIYLFPLLSIYASAVNAGLEIKLSNIIEMKMRRVPPAKIIKPMIKAEKEYLKLSLEDLESHYLAGGNVESLVDALIKAKRMRVDISFEEAAARDLAGMKIIN